MESLNEQSIDFSSKSRSAGLDLKSLESLVAELQKANWAYHNTHTTLMTDEEYDRKLEELKKKAPHHPFLTVIGAPVSKNGVLLPYTMASLDKVRFGDNALSRWLKKNPVSKVTITEKLDGLSALYVCNGGKQNLYLRGDGVKGVNVSKACSVLSLPNKTSMVIRGEILLPNDKTPEGSIGRSLVNGWLHRVLGGETPVELASCHFVAYQLLEPAGLTRFQQYEWLKKEGFRVPQFKVMLNPTLNEDKAKELLIQWKQSSNYPLDGIVIGFDTVPTPPGAGEAKNPDDSIAFKASLDEQKAETVVLGIEWNISRQNIFVPRIQIKPVIIGGAKIEWLSGHNASFIVSNGIGPSAQIVIRRSGDVIPTLDSVIKKVTPVLPDSCEWDETHVNLIVKKTDTTPEESEKSIQHCLSVLGVEGIGPGLVKKVVEGELNTMKKIYEATPLTLSKYIGTGRAPTFVENLRTKVASGSQLQLLIASNLLPRGVGEKKLRSLYAISPDAKVWSLETLGSPAGWSRDSLEELLESLPKAFEWIQNTFGIETKGLIIKEEQKEEKETLNVVFTGCRVKELSAKWKMEDSVTKKTNLLVVADSAIEKETTKTKKAKELGVEIVSLSEFMKRN